MPPFTCMKIHVILKNVSFANYIFLYLILSKVTFAFVSNYYFLFPAVNRSVSKINREANTSMTTAMSTENLTMMASPSLQGKHNDSILNILNTGSLRQLQQLPTIGPKTAMVISNFRLVSSTYESLAMYGVFAVRRVWEMFVAKGNLVKACDRIDRYGLWNVQQLCVL